MRRLIQNGDADSSIDAQYIGQLEPIVDNRLSISTIVRQSYSSLASIIGETDSRNLDLIETIKIIDFEVVLIYILLGLIIFSLSTFKMMTSLWLILRSIVRQNYSLRIKSRWLKMASCWFAIALFWLHCMYGNLMSTDLVAAPPPVLVDSITELLVSNREPMFGFYAHHVFSTSRNQKWREVLSRSNHFLRKLEDILGILDKMARKDGAILVTTGTGLSLLERAYCMKLPEVNRFYKGCDKFGESNEARLLNVNISRHLRAAINRGHSAVEMYGIGEKIFRRDFAELALGQSSEVDRCLANKGYRKNKMVTVTQIKYHNVQYLLSSTIMIQLVMGLVVIFIEKRTNKKRIQHQNHRKLLFRNRPKYIRKSLRLLKLLSH